jgi:hypothetical protein
MLVSRNSGFSKIINHHTIDPDKIYSGSGKDAVTNYSHIISNLYPTSTDLPSKTLEYIANSKGTTNPGTIDNLNHNELFNRAQGYIYNNWYGTPFIFDDNTLRFI